MSICGKSMGEEIMKEITEWIGSDDFKARLEKELGMPFDDAVVAIKAKVQSNPDDISAAFNRLLCRVF